MRQPPAGDQGPAEWIGSSAAERADALEDLLGLADALPQGLRPPDAPSLTEKVTTVHRALADAKLPHAVGGALAYAYYGEPRTTVDIDVNVFVPVSRWPEVRDALEPSGIEVDVDTGDLAQSHEIRLPWHRNTVHLFFSHDALHESMPDRVRQVPFAGGSIPIVSPEHLVIRKATLDRGKDWPDIEAILIAADSLDLDEIESWVSRLVGTDDPRVARLQDLTRRLRDG